MFQLRRSAFRLLANPSISLTARSRTITSISHSAFRSARQTSLAPTFQRRWASEDAHTETPVVAKEEPTPQDVVENAIQEDSVGSSSEPSPNSENVAKAPIFERKETLYIGNLFFDVTEKDLEAEFERFGKLTNIKIIRDARGFSKGFGYLSFEKAEMAEAAQKDMNQAIFEGRRISLQYAQRNSFAGQQAGSRGAANPPTKTLFLGNLSFEMTDRDLNNLFRGIKNVIDVRVAIDRRTGQPRGFAHADFIDVQSAVEARKVLEHKETYGRKLRIDYSQPATRERERSSSSQGSSDRTSRSDRTDSSDQASGSE